MRGRLASSAGLHVVGLYKLTISRPLDCQTEVAALLHNHSWIGSWNYPNDEQQGVKWYTRNDVLWLIYHFLYSTPQSYGRQAYLADMYKERVTGSLLALAATALNLALREWAKGTKQIPVLDFEREFFEGISSINILLPHDAALTR